jgi:hypothetical protein
VIEHLEHRRCTIECCLIPNCSGCFSFSRPTIAPEHYDFLLREDRRDRPAMQAFLAALRDEQSREVQRMQAIGVNFASARSHAATSLPACAPNCTSH